MFSNYSRARVASRRKIYSAVAMISLAALSQARAADFTWDGGSIINDNWGNFFNWSPDGAPPTNSAANDFVMDGHIVGCTLDSAYTIRSLRFASGAGAFDFTGNTLTINGTGGLLPLGIQNDGFSTQTLSNNVTLGGDQIWNHNGGNIVASGTVNFNTHQLISFGFSGLWMDGRLSGTGEFVVANNTNTTTTLAGTISNTRVGLTSVNSGILSLAKTANVAAVQGDLVVGDGTGGALVDVLRVANAGQIPDTSDVRVNSSGLFTVNALDTVNGVTLEAGSINGTGTLGISGGLSTVAAASSASVGVHTNLNSGTRNFDVANGSAGDDLLVTSTIANGTVFKTGPGRMAIRGTDGLIIADAIVDAGSLFLGVTAPGAAIGGDLTVGRGGVAATSELVRLEANEQIASSTLRTVFIKSTGTLDLAGFTETLYRLNMNAGTVAIGGGTLAIVNDFTSVASNATARVTASSLGRVDLMGDSVTFTVADGGATDDVAISAPIHNGTLVKAGPGQLLLTGVNSYAGGTQANGGRLQVGNADALGTGQLVVNNGVRVTLLPDLAKAVKLPSMTIAASTPNVWIATVDINNNAMVIDYSGAASPLLTHLSQIRSGHANGAWTGMGITSSTAATVTNRGIGYAEASDIFTAFPATFEGRTVDSTAVLIKQTYYGDTDLNGMVDFDDYSRTDAGFNLHRTGWFNGDFDYNGIVDFDDYSLIDLAFNTQSGTLRRAMSYLDGSDRSDQGMNGPALQIVRDHFDEFGNRYASTFLSAVPEPNVMVALLVALCPAHRRRRSS
jgi:autotransporter-associated beta strand protein